MSNTENIISKFNDTKTLPHVVTKLSKLINNPDSTIKEFEDVIKMDPVLVARLLQLVNSPFFGLTQKVDSIGRAVAFLGMKNLHNLAVTDALKSIFSKKKRNQTFSRQKLWLHCAAVSICAKMVAERIFGINGDDAYLCGILHDFGIIVEDQVDNSTLLKICDACGPGDDIIALENKYLNTNHCKIGYLMTKEWNMPASLQEAIRDHHNYSDEIPPESLTGIIQIAEYISAQMDYKVLPDLTPQLAPTLAQHIEDNIDEYQVLIDDLPDEMEKAQDMHGTKEG